MRDIPLSAPRLKHSQEKGFFQRQDPDNLRTGYMTYGQGSVKQVRRIVFLLFLRLMTEHFSFEVLVL